MITSLLNVALVMFFCWLWGEDQAPYWAMLSLFVISMDVSRNRDLLQKLKEST